MNPFKDYAAYYNLIYRDKNYESEADYIISLLNKTGKSVQTIAELGCGTGGHALCFAKKGFRVDGFDLSSDMIGIARSSLTTSDSSVKEQVTFSVGDIRSLDVRSKRDMVLSLFHVMSYQNSNTDLISSFRTASDFLNPGGVFIFDCWYGPGVLRDLPVRKEKNFENDHLKITRLTVPEMKYNENVVDVHFYLTILNKLNGSLNELHEIHPMRYFFLPELTHFLDLCGFRILNARNWMTDQAPDENCWYLCVTAEKVA
ncbi:MAG: class I SAM-dependent methyltransferase [Bacteroidetes bacterium]|nr:class I SAM-dependent methyltransferase [Bacteroidota bacterium]